MTIDKKILRQQQAMYRALGDFWYHEDEDASTFYVDLQRTLLADLYEERSKTADPDYMIKLVLRAAELRRPYNPRRI